jgi:hypothetical protein
VRDLQRSTALLCVSVNLHGDSLTIGAEQQVFFQLFQACILKNPTCRVFGQDSKGYMFNIDVDCRIRGQGDLESVEHGALRSPMDQKTQKT